jgi:RNA polymerase sigma-70 factor (ECF subfamily)
MADADAFRSLYRAHHRRVCAYLAVRADADLVEDLAAETFLVAWRRQAEMPAHVLPWLLNTAAKCLANERRSGDRRRALRERLREAGAEPASLAADADRAAQRRALITALEAVAEPDRELLLLRHWDGLAPREIAAVVELSPVVVRARLHRATRRLQLQLRAALEREDVPVALELRGTPHVT